MSLAELMQVTFASYARVAVIISTISCTMSMFGLLTYPSASASGWFIIQNIKWIYDRDNPQRGTQWQTELTLTRREWPIPGYIKD